MAGHSKWANIKHRKSKADKIKGKIFSRIAKEIISAVKQGGPDPKANGRLRLAIQKARAANVSSDVIERNVTKASSAGGSDYTEMTYELYGHGGVGIIAEIMTDNRNRIASDLRIATNKRGGIVASPGAVSYNFEQKGVIQVLKKNALTDELFLLATESGAEDFEELDDCYMITTAADQLLPVKEMFDAKKVLCEIAELQWLPKVYVSCNAEDMAANLALFEWIEGIDDVDALYHNMEEL